MTKNWYDLNYHLWAQIYKKKRRKKQKDRHCEVERTIAK